VKLLKRIHSTVVPEGKLPDIKETVMKWVTFMLDYLPEEAGKKLIAMVEAVPKDNHMIHGDYHTNNVMVQSDGELVLIDMADISRGNSLFDIGGTFLTMYLSGMNRPEVTEEVIGLKYEYAKKVWGITLSTYYGTTDPQKLELLGNRCAAFALLRMANTLGIGSERARQNADPLVALLRQRLFPNVENFCKLFAMPV
jgi:hypothetical protein